MLHRVHCLRAPEMSDFRRGHIWD